MGENVKLIFKRALSHYVDVLQKLKSDKEIEFSNDIFQVDIQDNIGKLERMLKGLDSPDPEPLSTLESNRELLCRSLQNYINDLENMKETINSKLRSSEPSIPTINFKNVDEEIALAKRIQTSSCFEKGF